MSDFAAMDIGTYSSLISTIDVDNEIILVPDLKYLTSVQTPSLISLDERIAYVGRMAEIKAKIEKRTQVHSYFKRRIGEDNPLFIDPKENQWFAESFYSLLIKKLALDYQMYKSKTLNDLVLTVPAHFSDLQRKLCYNACSYAGIQNVYLLNEPLAAVIHYSKKYNLTQGIYLVYDFGGGTFDVSIIQIQENGTYVLATEGLNDCGGKDGNDIIMEMIHESLSQHISYEDLSALQLHRLKNTVEDLKQKASRGTDKDLLSTFMLGTKEIELVISRAEYEQRWRTIVQKTFDCCRKCMDEAGLTAKDMEHFLLVGGTAQFEKMTAWIGDEFDYSPSRILMDDAEQAVCLGAGLFAAKRAGVIEYHILDQFRNVSPYNLAIKTGNTETPESSSLDILIPKNIPLPYKSIQKYYLSNLNQQSFSLQLFQYFDDESNLMELGVFEFGPVVGAFPGYHIELEIEMNEEATISLKVFDPQTGRILKQNLGKKNLELQKTKQQHALIKNTVINGVL